MEPLFSTNIAVNDKDVLYQVVFDKEKYIFTSETDSSTFPSFSVRRENDEWHWQEMPPAAVQQQAIDALEKFLLAQH